MNKPQMKSEIAVDTYDKSSRLIRFHGSKDAMEDTKQFGTIFVVDFFADLYTLYVDARYDFDEVLDYIQEYK